MFNVQFKLNINATGFSSFLVTQLFHLNYIFEIVLLETLYIQISAYYKLMPICLFVRLYNSCGELEGWDQVKQFSHTRWVALVTHTDRPKSVRNRCVIEIFGGVCVLSRCFLGFSVGVRSFVIELGQISSFSLPLFIPCDKTFPRVQ